MAKVTKKTNYRVVVHPRTHIYGIALHNVERDCQSMVEQIKRHVDDVHDVYVEHDTEVTCSHCGYAWEVDEHGTPQCCTRAQTEAISEKFNF